MADSDPERIALSKRQRKDLQAFFYHVGWRYPEEMRKVWAKAMADGAARTLEQGPPDAEDAPPVLPPALRLQPVASGQVGDTSYTIYGR
jgi:hypothetical protein